MVTLFLIGVYSGFVPALSNFRLGVAAGCEAVALARRKKLTLVPGSCLWFGLRPYLVNGATVDPASSVPYFVWIAFRVGSCDARGPFFNLRTLRNLWIGLPFQFLSLDAPSKIASSGRTNFADSYRSNLDREFRS
jgi:hypothetical protein